MEHDFWNERWQAGQTAFHQGAGHPQLESRLEGLPRGRALVPLAGKTVDVVTLHRHGYDVVAVEFVETAVRSFGAEQPQLGLNPTTGPLGLELTGERLRFMACDFFAVTPEQVGQFDLVYDRAALVALPPSDQRRYVDHLRTLVAPGGQFSRSTFEYDVREMNGPPFSVPEAAVRDLYAGANVQRLDSKEVLSHASPLAARGLTALTEHTFVIADAAP